LTIERLQQSPEGIRIEYPAVSGFYTRIAISENLAGLQSWSITNILLGGVSGTQAWERAVIAGSGPVRFYRVEAWPLEHAGDADGDWMDDVWELVQGLGPLNPADGGADADGDGLSNVEKYSFGTNPNRADSDGDGIPDGAEVSFGTAPTVPASAAMVRIRFPAKGKRLP
jgi:hypothetical protein